MMEKICMNCEHSLLADEKKMTYQCRRYAPRRIHGVGTGENKEMFPMVRLDDWCGEFRIRGDIAEEASYLYIERNE